jgi:hypothetical protein
MKERTLLIFAVVAASVTGTVGMIAFLIWREL